MNNHSLPTEQPTANAASLNPQAHTGDQPTTKHAVLLTRDLYATAKAVGDIIGEMDLYEHSGKFYYPDHLGEMQVMTPAVFRNWINHQGVITYRKFNIHRERVTRSMTFDEAESILCSLYLLRKVKPLPVNVDEEGGRL